MEGAGRVRLLFVGSWTRVLVTAVVLIALWGAFAWLAVSGRLGALKYLNVPLVHPYPPAGYVQNPFDPSDRSDLINVGQAARVKTDLLADGTTEVLAAEKGDQTLLSLAATGRALDKLIVLLQQEEAQGVFEHVQNHFDSVVAGRLPDPNDPAVTWAVEEKGTAEITYTSRTSGMLVRTERVRFDNTFWLVQVGQRYLITDALIRTDPVQ